MTTITFTLRVIEDQMDYDAVVERISQIFDASPATPEGYELELLLIQVDNYQRKISLLPEVEPVEVIKFIMKQRGFTLQDIAPYLGGKEMATQILSSKAELTPHMIRSLSANLYIPVSALI